MSKPHIYAVQQILGSYSKLDKGTFLLFWEQFVKWCYLQFQANRHISLGPSGDYGFKLQENTNNKIPFFFFNDHFLNKSHLSLKIKTFVLKPLVKLNSSAISKYLPKKIKEEDVHKILNHMIDFLQAKLKDKNEQFIVIDFDILGKIIRNNNEVWFQHSLPPKKDSLRNTSIRFQVNKEESKFSNFAPLSKLSLLSSQQGFLPKIQKRQLKSSQKQKQTPKKTDFILQQIPRTSTPAKDQPFSTKRKLSLFKINPNQNLQQNSQTNLAKRSVSLKDFSKTKLNAIYKPVDFGDKKNGTEGWEMMAAGPDPIKKAETFSKLTTDLKGLMQAKFSFNQQQLQDNIPIIDTFSRTLACPIAAQRQNVLVAGRIGGNYCLNSQKIEVREEGVRFVKLKNMILGSTDIQKENNLIGEIEEYAIITKEPKTDDDQMVLDGLKKSFERYNKLFRMIPDEHLIKMQGDAVDNFLDKIKFNINKNPHLFDHVFQQIQHNYSNAIKKSIVDYILLDPVERIRLFVNYKSRQVKMYGSTEKQQTVWKDFSFISVKQTLETKLMKNSRNVMRIIEEWKKTYLQLPVINIPSSFTEYFTIDDFWDKQKIQIKKFQQIILNQWIPNLSEIYQLQTFQLQKNMEKCQQFFESTNTLLYIQLRQKIISILTGYNQFFQIFNFEELNPPETVVHLQKSLGRYEKSFITVRVSHRREQIYFMDNMDDIHTKLLEIVDLLRAVSVNVPRPQNLITKSNKHYLQRIQEDEVDFARLKKQISTIIKRNIENTKKSLQIFNKYQYLLTEMRQIEDWIENKKHDRREYSLIMTKYRKLYDEIMEEVPFFIRVNMIYVDSSELKRFFLSLVQQILVRIQQSVHSLVMRKNNEIQASLQQMILVASSYATDCQKLVQIENQVENFRRNDIKKLQNQKQDLIKWIAITLYNTYYPVNAEDLAKIYSTSQFLTNIYSLLDKENFHIQDQRIRLQTEVRRQSSSLNLKTHTLVKQCQKLRQFSGTIVKDSALSLIRQCRHKITQYKEQKKTVNKKEELLGIQQTELAKLLEWDKNLVPFEDLWNLVDNYSAYYQSWSKQNIFKQNSQLIGSECKAMLRTLMILMNHQMLKNFAPLSLKMAENVSEEIKKFQANIPLIAAFSNPGLKDRHLKKIADTIQFKGDLTSLKGLNLQKLVLMNGHQYIKELEVISYEATREYAVELVIKKVKQQWKEIAFEIVKYKDNETSIITGSCLQMVEGLLEVHLLEVLSVKGSIYAKIFEQELQELQNWLSSTLELVQYSAKVQNYWTYLEPVMNSHDILKHLSVEGSKFLLVDDQFKKISVFYNQTRNVVEITKNKEVVKNLKNCLKNIEIVQKGLSSYLDSKRMNFPRFFSLSDRQLLEILSQKKDPLGLQKHVRKCFEGIEKLKFEQNQYIVGMVSRYGEQVPFSSKINTLMARGNVDEMMKEIEQKMFNNVKRQIDETLADYNILQRNQIINKRIQMTVITAQQIRWTATVQESIVGHKLKQLTEKIGNDLKELMQLVKQQNLDLALTLKLESLLILAVKNRQIGESLEKKSIHNIQDFEWQAQIKFYQFQIEQTKEIRCSAKIFGTSIPFNYEYLGNYSRLVITPLTDRCHRTIFLAMKHNLGGALQGPPGTGKTQTVKDLAKALAYRCIVFNCSQLLDFKTIARILKGLASTGSWGCFDGLNQTSMDVLSVVGQQIYVIQKAKTQKKNMFFFEDIELKLKSGTQIFITLNPLSATKISLPENLKSQFRPIAMITLDIQKVCEVLLLIGGFSQSEVLAAKLINCLKLAQNYLSETSWQGGMKTIKCLVNKAIELKKNDSKESEEKIVAKSISATIFPRLIKQDLILCKGILKDWFGENPEPEMSNDVLVQKIRAQMNEQKLTLTQYGTQKMLQLHKMLAVRRQIILTGQPYSGKSTAIQILRLCMNKLEGQANIQMAKINPKSIDLKQLVGAYDSSSDWFDGILGVKLRLLAEQGSEEMKWLILDGPLDHLGLKVQIQFWMRIKNYV